MSGKFKNNVKGALAVGADEAHDETENISEETQAKLLERARMPFRNWLLGMFISFIPILGYPLFLMITDASFSLGKLMPLVFCTSEVIFLAISLSISSMNDSETIREWRHYGWWHAFSWFFIILGAVLFGIVSVAEKTNSIVNENVVMAINIVLFVVATISGAIPYMVAISDVKKKIKEGKV